MKKYQKGYTIVELMIVLWGLLILLLGLSLVGAVIYALGKFLFGWW